MQSTGISGNVQEKVLKAVEPGYDGYMWEEAAGDIPQLITELEQNDMVLWTRFNRLGVDWDAELELIKDTEADILVTLQGYSDEAQAVADLQALADKAAAVNRNVIIYPHVDYLVEEARMSVKLIELADRENLGTMFNLCHTLMFANRNNLDIHEEINYALETAFPYFMGVSISGADTVGLNWGILIKPLVDGNFDLFNLVKEIVDRGYTGPWALQMFGIGGDDAGNLANSMDVWRDYQARLPIQGCMDSTYEEYNPDAGEELPGSCVNKIVGIETIPTGSGILFRGMTVSVPGGEPHAIRVINLKGEPVYSDNNSNSEIYYLPDLVPEGMYVIVVESRGTIERKKLAIIRGN